MQYVGSLDDFVLAPGHREGGIELMEVEPNSVPVQRGLIAFQEESAEPVRLVNLLMGGMCYVFVRVCVPLSL